VPIVFVTDDGQEVREAARSLLASVRLQEDMCETAMGQSLSNERRGDPGGTCHARVIAIVDDDEGFRDALQLFLRTCAFQVEVFASGEDFLRSSRLEAVGCVILDLAMPEMNGLEVQQRLAARGLQIPIVFVTAHRDDYLGQRASATSALAVLRKPADDEELVRLLREALGGQ
jgi:FixJ family two-component response regulator